MQTQIHQITPSIPAAVKAVFEPISPKFPDDALLREYQGDVLIVQAGERLEVFSLQQDSQPVEIAAGFIAMAQEPDASYLVGGITSSGGKFRSVTREEAIGKMGNWIFEVI